MRWSKYDYDDDEDDDGRSSTSSAAAEKAERAEQLLIKDNVYNMQLERFKLFKTQDPENGKFDVIFEIDGKKLYANKHPLITISETLDVMLSERWSTKDEPVKIENNSFEDFYEFVSFLYSGQCKLTPANVFNLTDIAEFYGVPIFKAYCDRYLSKLNDYVDKENVYEMLELAQKYSLKDFQNHLKWFCNRNFKVLFADAKFLTLKRELVELIFSFRWSRQDSKEEYFDAFYKWAEHQALAKQAATAAEEGFDIHEAIKAEFEVKNLKLDFSRMKLAFIIKLIAEKRFLHPTSEWYKLLVKSQRSNVEEEKVFETAYQMAEKEAMEKEKASTDEIFNLTDTIKAELAEILPSVRFFYMSEKFLIDFVVKKGFMSHDSAVHAHDIQVQIKNGDKTISGTLKDTFGLYDAIQRHQYTKISPRSDKKQRFSHIKLTVPSTPSTVSKMKGVEWYLVLEKDGVLTFKHVTNCGRNDYFLAEMKCKEKYQLAMKRHTFLTATRV